MAKVEKARLIEAADEMHQVMKLDEKVDPESDEKHITKWITTAAELIEPEKDIFSEETLEVFAELGIDVPGTDGEPEAGEEPKTLVEQLDDVDDMRELKAMVKANNEFKTLRSSITKYKAGQEEDLKEAMFELLNGEPETEEEKAPAKKAPAKKAPAKKAPAAKAPAKKAPAKKKEKAEPAPSFSRYSAMAEVLKEDSDLDREDAAEKADALYCEKTGKSSNIKEQADKYSRVLQVMKVFDLA